jgi:hypothetical protein
LYLGENGVGLSGQGKVLCELLGKVDELISISKKTDGQVTASRLSKKSYGKFKCGPLTFHEDDYLSIQKDPLFDAVSQRLHIFEDQIRQNINDGKTGEVKYCQPQTDALLRDISPMFFGTHGEYVTCLREYTMDLVFRGLTAEASKLDHIMMMGQEDTAREDGVPLTGVECKNLNWDFRGENLWQPKGQALFYLSGIADAFASRMQGRNPPLMYIMLQSGCQWLLLRRKLCEIQGQFMGQFLFTSTDPVTLLDANTLDTVLPGHNIIVCWLIICLTQAKTLVDDIRGPNSVTVLTSAMAKISLGKSDTSRSRPNSSNVDKSKSSTNKGNARASNIKSSKRNGGRNYGMNILADSVRDVRIVDENSSNSEWNARHNILPLTTSNLSRGLRGAVKHIFESATSESSDS